MADSTPKSYHTDPTLYLYTSLTAGSSHIITATSRLETILKANRIPFQALDVATDEKARMLWGRRAGKRKLPGLVRMGMLVGDLEEVEEWNEYGELKDKVGVSLNPSTPSATNTPTKAPPATSTPSKLSTFDTPSKQSLSHESPTRIATESPMATAMRQAGMEAAKKAGDAKAAALARAGVPSKLPSEAQKELTQDKSTMDNEASSEKDVYEGQGSKDPDKEAMIPNSKDTVEGDDISSATGIKSHDPDSEAVISGSKDKINPEAGATSSDDPDAEAAVPGSKEKTEDRDDEVSSHSKRSDDGSDSTKGQGTSTVEKTTMATTASGGAEDLPGKRTQDQDPADAEEVGASVAD